ncbi:MAG: hypothetical protein AB1Z98_27165 [Nannocystaceae bacterium]
MTIYQTTTQANTDRYCWANSWAAEGVVSVDSRDPTKLRVPCDENNKCNVVIVNLGTEVAGHILGTGPRKSLYGLGAPPSDPVTVDLASDVGLDLFADGQTNQTPYATLTLHK